jgi:hypothetical protein
MKSTVRKINIGRGVSKDTNVWRYLDFSRFVSLIENRAIHFCHVSVFEDKYDGVFNCLNTDDHYDITTEGKIVRIDAASLDSRSAENSARFKEFIALYHQAILRSTGVSCWRLDDHESHAMWRIFVKSDEGVAIESTIGKLTSSVSPGDYRLLLGKVRYIDYAKQKIPITNLMNSFFYKNRYFEHEKELRLLCYRVDGVTPGPVPLQNYRPLPAGGLELPVDVSKLIQGIHISPYAPKWFDDLVNRVVQRYGFDIPVYPSIIALRKA